MTTPNENAPPAGTDEAPTTQSTDEDRRMQSIPMDTDASKERGEGRRKRRRTELFAPGATVEEAPQPEKPMREPISQSLRFEIFKRDNFRCVYCGAGVLAGRPLHIDHVKPVALGGKSTPENLVTACLDCNGGKSARPLDAKRFEVSKVTPADLEYAEQIRAWLGTQRQASEAKGEVFSALEDEWAKRVGEPPRTLRSRLPNMVREFGYERLVEAFEIVGAAREDRRVRRSEELQYLHGVLRRWRGDAAPKPQAQAPVATGDAHVERCARAVSHAIRQTEANPEAFPDGRSQRIHVLRAFVSAAWGGRDEMEWIESSQWLGQGAHSFRVRGITIHVNEAGAITVTSEPDLNVHEVAFDELSAAVQCVLYEQDETKVAERVKELAQTNAELDLWLALRKGAKGVLEYAETNEQAKDILKHWEVDPWQS